MGMELLFFMTGGVTIGSLDSFIEIIDYSDVIDLQPEWLIVFLLLFIIICIKDFKPIDFIEPGGLITVGQNDSILDTTLWTEIETGKTVKVINFRCSGIYAQKISDYRLLLRSASKFEKGSLWLETSHGSLEIPVTYGLGSDYYYLVPHNVRYFQYRRNEFALVSDVLLGLSSEVSNHLYHDLKDGEFTRLLRERLQQWECEVQAGKLLRPTAEKYGLPMGLIKYLAGEGKQYRMNCTTSSQPQLLPPTTSRSQAIPLTIPYQEQVEEEVRHL